MAIRTMPVVRIQNVALGIKKGLPQYQVWEENLYAMKIVHIDTFSGIGGASIAVDAVFGKENVTHIFCDNEPFAQAILKKHWPKAPIYDDIKTFDATQYAGAFILTGGFPCQPFSSAGKRRGTEDDRHLWPQMLRVIRESHPQWVIGENVGGLVTWNGGMVLDSVITDLEAEGYEVWPFIIPAVSVGAPHRRDRVWIIANAIGGGTHRGNSGEHEEARGEERLSERDEVEQSRIPGEVRDITHTPSNRRQRGGEGVDTQKGYEAGSEQGRELEGRPQGLHSNTSDTEEQRREWDWNPRNGGTGLENQAWNEHWLEVATRLCVMDDGLSSGLARPRGWRNAALKGAGNAWVPQVAIEILQRIKEIS